MLVDIHGPDARDGLLHEVFDGLPVTDVAGDGNDLAGERRELPRGGFQVFQFPAGDDHLCAGCGQPPGDGLADAATAARHEGDFIL
jgi:hypothetical protein